MYEVQCLCLTDSSISTGGSAEVNAFLNVDAGALSANLEGCGNLLSPADNIDVCLPYEVCSDGYGPHYSIIAEHPGLIDGKSITIDDIEYEIVGVVDRRGGTPAVCTTTTTIDPNCIEGDCGEDPCENIATGWKLEFKLTLLHLDEYIRYYTYNLDVVGVVGDIVTVTVVDYSYVDLYPDGSEISYGPFDSENPESGWPPLNIFNVYNDFNPIKVFKFYDQENSRYCRIEDVTTSSFGGAPDDFEYELDINLSTEADPDCCEPYFLHIFSLLGPAILEDGELCFDSFSENENPIIEIDVNNELVIESSSAIEDGMSLDANINQILIGEGEIIEPRAQVEVIFSTLLESNSDVEVSFVDKFIGDFPEYFDLLSYGNNERLYPSGDRSLSQFVASDGSTSNLYSYIDEGVFVGQYIKDKGWSILITDDLNTYVTPNTNNTEGEFVFSAYVDKPIIKPLDSRLLIRLSAPLNNLESEIPPRYTIKDAKFLDPNNKTIVSYEDISFSGDASDDAGDNKFNNFTTVSLKPSQNVVAEKYQWQSNYPDLYQPNGYFVNFTVVAESYDDPFDEGFNIGFSEDIESGNSPIYPTNSIRISAVEVFNSGFPGIGPSPENYMPFFMGSRQNGNRLERKIYPSLIPYSGIDTISCVSWDVEDSVCDFCEGDYAKTLRDPNEFSAITVENVTEDSGNLTLKFGTGPSTVNEITPGSFGFGFDQSTNNMWFTPSGAFNTFNRNENIQSDNVFFIPESLTLHVLAKKKDASVRDYVLDVYGYSDDCILHVTSKTCGFIQNVSGVNITDPESDTITFYGNEGSIPVSSGFSSIDDLGIDGEAISDKAQYFETGQEETCGDHHLLATYPVISSEEYQWYEIPLEIYEDKVDIGASRDYNISTFLESFFLDLYPLPSGASIASMYVSVRYAPQTGFNLATQGGEYGRLQPGRSEGSFYPTSRSATDRILNAGSGYNPLSTIEGIPHAYRSPDTLKTNYSHRWRGKNGLSSGPWDIDQFDFGFESPLLDFPFVFYSNFSSQQFVVGSEYKLISTDLDVYHSGIAASVTGVYKRGIPEVYQNIGFRFNGNSLFSSQLPGFTGPYRTADWTSLSNGGSDFTGHDLYGKIYDGYDNIVRLNDSSGFEFDLTFEPNPFSGGFAIFSRFIPDATFDASSSTIWSLNDGNSVSYELIYDAGQLKVRDVVNASDLLVDTLNSGDYQYPLSVLVAYINEDDSHVMRLYTDNEGSYGDFTYLRDEANPVIGIDSDRLHYGSNGLLVGNGANILLCEIGFNAENLSNNGVDEHGPSGMTIVESDADRTLRRITAEEFFDNIRMKYFNPSEPHTNDTYKLWDYVNEDTYNDWYLGAYDCGFNFEYDTIGSTKGKRSGRDLISFSIDNDGVPYIYKTDLALPDSINSGVSYHSQIENDFLRFHLTDTVDSFESVYPRVRKDLPRGYKFTEGALLVDTIVNHTSSGSLLWGEEFGCQEGPKLIVSLYTHKQQPYWTVDGEDNYGLINRSIHYLDSKECIFKVTSTFNHQDVCDETEEWAYFKDEQVAKDFDDRLFSDDIDQMFLQYDLVYPSSTAFTSRIDIHSAHVRTENAFVSSTSTDDEIDLFTSGVLGIENNYLDFYTDAIEGIVQDSGTILYMSGEQPVVFNGQIDLYTFGVSGAPNDFISLFCDNTASGDVNFDLYTVGDQTTPYSGELELFTIGKAVIDNSPNKDGSGGATAPGESFGLPLSLFNPEVLKGSDDNTLKLFTFAPIGGFGSMVVGDGETAGAYNSMRLFAYNDLIGGDGVSSSALTEALVLATDGGQPLASRFRSVYHPLFIDGSPSPVESVSTMPLYLRTIELEENKNFASLDMSIYNIHGIGGVCFEWDSFDYGLQIEAQDNERSSLDIDNEIRGVNTVGYGSCDGDSPRKAIDPPLITDGIIWREEKCEDGGVFRAFSTYTNLSVDKDFSDNPGSYSGNYYDIRKYDRLDPLHAYRIVLEIETGSTEGIDQPRDWEEWEYGICGSGFFEAGSGCCTGDCDEIDNLQYSGVKLISDLGDSETVGTSGRQEGAFYGKSVDVTQELMAVGAPSLTIYDEYDEPITSGGAVFLYRRDEDVAGKKAAWQLDRKLTLPSGFIRDFVAPTNTNAVVYPTTGVPEFAIPYQQWSIGQEGREFGHDVAIASSGDTETLVVSAPGANWTRTFEELNVSGIPVALAVFTDKFINDEKIINRIASEARVYDLLYNYFAVKWGINNFTFQPELDIKFLVYHVVTYDDPRTPIYIKNPDLIKHTYIDKLSSVGLPEDTAGLITEDSINNSVRDLFIQAFPQSDFAHSGLPPILGVFVETSPSTRGGADVIDTASNFIDFYQDYVYESGVIDPEFGTSDSGYYNQTFGESENWGQSSVNLLNDTLDTGNLIDNDALRYIASGFDPDAVGPLATFQSPPYSGGRVYIFDNEFGEINLIQEVKSYYERPIAQASFGEEDDQITNIGYGAKDFKDRFGHSVDISKNANIITIGSPWTTRPCEVYERVESENDRMYENIRDWFVHASGSNDYNGLSNIRTDFSDNIDRYDEIAALSGDAIAQIESYKELNASDKFFYRSDSSFWGNNIIELYKKIYDFNYDDIPYIGTWSYLASEFAPTSRLGYSCAVDEDGRMLAFGAPTDSFNEFDDYNVWYGGTLELDSGNNRWPSTTNAGAVRVFQSRKFYSHSGVVEFTRFGNLDRSLHIDDDDVAYDSLGTYYGQEIEDELSAGIKPRSFRRMAFEEKRIPQDAGVAYIITPERDIISDAGGEEILNGIKEWLALGDRTLVLVANDPTYEENGVYRDSTDIVNRILERLGSRMVVTTARSEEESLPECAEEGEFNLIRSFQPAYNHTTFADYYSNISTDRMYAYGVGDIKIKLRGQELSIFDGNGIQQPCEEDALVILNPEVNLPLKQLGDLRSQWNSICSICGPNGCAEIEYKTNWPMYFNNPNPSQSCDNYPKPGNLDSSYEDPRPILTVSKKDPDIFWFVPEQTITETEEVPIYGEECWEASSTREYLSDEHLDELSFNIYENPFQTNGVPSGTYDAFTLNTFTNPAALNLRNPILQAIGQVGDPIMRQDGERTEEVSPDSPLVVEEVPSYAGNNSRIVMIASTRPETRLNLGFDSQSSAPDDKNASFYSSLAKFDCDTSGVVYQIGGWTGRDSFDSVYSDFEFTEVELTTSSSLKTLFDSHGHLIQENFTTHERYNEANTLWIADPNGYDADDVQRIKEWLVNENKTLVITYNLQPTVLDETQDVVSVISGPFKTIENITQICDKLELQMKPAFSQLIGEYQVTTTTRDATPQVIDYEYELVSGCENGFTWDAIGNWPASYTRIDNLNAYLDGVNSPNRREEFVFCPIVTSGVEDKVIKYNESLNVSVPIYVEDTYFTINAQGSIDFPVVADSGYRLFINYVSETNDDKISTQATATTDGDGGEFNFANLEQTPNGVVQKAVIDFRAGSNSTQLTLDFNSSSSELIEDEEVFVEPRSVRVLSASGCPLPIITEVTTTSGCRSVIIGYETVVTTTVIPARSGVITGSEKAWSSDRDQYLPPSLEDCGSITNKTTIEDGPVVAAEEIENFSSFSAGKRRSRIVLVTDSTIFQGKCTQYRDNALGDNQKFIRSLYLPSPQEYRDESNFENEEYYDTGTRFEYIQKLRSPETGSPAKYYSKLNEANVTSMFGAPFINPVAGLENKYRTDEDSFAPEDVKRLPNPFWTQVEPERKKFINYIESTYGVYPSFSGIFYNGEEAFGPLTSGQKRDADIPCFKLDANGNLIEINNPYYPRDETVGGGITVIQKLTGRDYLEYIDSFSGYPGDLFGHSLSMTNNKLVVGTPYNGYDYSKVWDWTEVSGVDSVGVDVSEYGGAGAVFFWEETNQGVNANSEFLPWQFDTKIKAESANVASGTVDKNDQFGRSVSIDSDMIAIGAPHHNESTNHFHVYSGDSAFLRKSFNIEFTIPQHIYEETSGDPIINDGVIYTYRHDLTDFGDRNKEVVFAEKLNKNGYLARFLTPSGTQDDRFGTAVAIRRSYRGDSDYTLVGGAPGHDHPSSGNHTTGSLLEAGAAFTYDAMLREQPKVIPTEGGFISARVFSLNDNDNTISLTVEQPVSGEPTSFKVSGVLFPTDSGEIFLEGSGYDPATRGFVAHRPFVKRVYGCQINGTPANEDLDLFMLGSPGSNSGDIYLVLPGESTQVYNNVDFFVSGQPPTSNDLDLIVSGERFYSSGNMDMVTIGASGSFDTLKLRVRGK